MKTGVWTAALGLGLLAAACAPAAPPADTILHHGKIITVDKDFSIAQAVAVKDGRILFVGSDAAVMAHQGAATRMIDLEGRTVMPGLIDNHNHIIRATEYWGQEARLEGVTSRAEALRLLAAKAASLPDGAWLFSLGGWTEEQFADSQEPFTLAELDAVAPSRPAFLQVGYSHGYANSAWLKAMRDVAALQPFIGRDETGQPTGRLNGGFPMVGAAIAHFPPVDEQAQIAGIKTMMGDLAAMGLTTVFDPGGLGVQAASYDRFRALADTGALDVRVFHTLWGGLVNTPALAQAYIGRLQTEKPFTGDDWFGPLAAGEVIYAPFHWDTPLAAATPKAEDIAIATQILDAAAAAGWPVQIHAIQGETIATTLDAIEAVNARHPVTDLRWTIAHADNIGANEIARAKALGLMLQIRSESAIGGVGAVFDRFGDAAFHMPPLRMIQDSGIAYGFGSDGTKAAQINPFVTLWWAVTGKMLNGDIVLRDTLSREHALAAHTRGNAPLLFKEGLLGEISPGALADMLVLDRDYLTVPPDEIKDIKPVLTMTGGRIVHGGW